MTLHNSDISTKLAALPKKSIFEKQKAEAEAKKAREKAETAAALEDFVKSFDDEGDAHSGFPPRHSPGEGGRGFGAGGGSGYGSSGPGKRHFTSTGLKSGPGSLGPTPTIPRGGPGSLGSVPAFGKKRQYDEYSGGRGRDLSHDRDHKNRVFAYNDGRDGRDSETFAREDGEDSKGAEELKAAAKPTLHLSSIPPGTSPAVIKGLFAPSPLTVENVRILPPAPGTAAERKSVSAIATLAAETPATDIDTTVSHLQNKYLGFGFNLSISRYLSSAALNAAGSFSNTPSLQLQNLPFGAKPVRQHTSLSRAHPPGQGPGRFAPPASYTSSTPYGPRSNNLPPTQVDVHLPTDLKQLRLIHKAIEALLTYGPEFEALLMSRPQIQRDEQWAWLWDSRSTGGVYYRWRLWEILTDGKSRRNQKYTSYNARQAQGDILFEGQATWIPPEEDIKFQYTTQIEEFISDEDYNSSDEEDMDEDRDGGLARRHRDHQKVGATEPLADNDGQGYLNPLGKTKLIHLLSRMPESNAKLRKGDVARVTGFAIEHAGAGADEVADLITRNVVRPFRYSVKRAKGENQREDEDSEGDENRDGAMESQAGTQNGDEAPAENKDTTKDTTACSLVAMYLISDILSASSTSGVRHAWRYRSLFQHHLLQQKTFETLGDLPKKYAWGKLRAEKWRRQVQVVLGLWEGWCVFEEARMREMADGFSNPPLSNEEEVRKAEKEAEEKGEKERSINRWRSVDTKDQGDGDGKSASVRGEAGDSDVEMNVDGTPMADDEKDDGDTILTDENIDGVPMVDSSDDEADGVPPPPAEDEDGETTFDQSGKALDPPRNAQESSAKPVHVPTVSQGRRMRPKAVDFDDMFE